jgi:hypothetical protein
MKVAKSAVFVVMAAGSWTAAFGQERLANEQFTLAFGQGGIASLKYTKDAFNTDFIQEGKILGTLLLGYRKSGGDWKTVRTSNLTGQVHGVGSVKDRSRYQVVYRIEADLELTETFWLQGRELLWTIALRNLGDGSIEIGDLAFPMVFNTRFARNKTMTETQRQIAHFWISGHGSFLYLMRPNSVGPYLVITPVDDTRIEYFDADSQPGAGRTWNLFLHSAITASRARERGGNWRQANSSVTLAPREQPGGRVAYGFKCRWGQGYEDVRKILYEENLFDVNVVPGMTVPTDLPALISLRTHNAIEALAAEFPSQTRVEYLGTRGPDNHIYKVTFSRLGENLLTIRYRGKKSAVMEFFVTEPLETLIKKRSTFLVTHQQHRDPSKWYNGLISDWDQRKKLLRSPDDTDGLNAYIVACDDPGLCKAPYVASKNVIYPDPREVEAIDYYIHHYVWGGLQCIETEPYPYAIYGIPNWKANRESKNPGRNGRLHLWRIYDYPHIILLYYRMYQIARLYPRIKTELTADNYLERAFGTARAFFTVPMAIEHWSAYETGTYNEVIIPDLIDALEESGKVQQAQELRGHWEKKVAYFVNKDPYLFGSEYAFDSTGFESTHALAKWALERMTGPARRPTVASVPVTREAAFRFLEKQLRANIADRGWLETAYYTLGSDYRAGMGGSYTLSYMSQMGGWAVLDYGLNYAKDPSAYLRLGYASYLSSWALVNSGTPESHYGFWYPGPENDGAAGGGFEPRAWATSWLRKSHPRGSWFYGCEIDLGYCGALRTAATIVAEDPIFGLIAYGGRLVETPAAFEVTLKDGCRQRLHVLRNDRRLHMILNRDGFAADQPVRIDHALRDVRFTLENRFQDAHTTVLELSGLPGRVVVEGLPAKITTIPTGSRLLLQIGPESRYPVTIRVQESPQ